ncbi:uncharacterized protein LOC117053180 [Lacerta agilis]|uniref:uncharacterized protein LOC117053180 n=1 Tax=Lacerta agilis TaxID=80427 RepID=UPI0014192849|nr:uncharacterized protein LOC117053180 [Lacerta agilis]
MNTQPSCRRKSRCLRVLTQEHHLSGGARIRCLRRLFSCCHKVAPQQGPEQPVAPVLLRFPIPSAGLLEEEQLKLLGVIQSCQAAELRTLKCSKQETAKAILDILRPLEHSRVRSPLTLALALEALLQLSTMHPKFSSDMLSLILHRTLEAVLEGPEMEEDRENLKQHYRLLLGSLLIAAPNPGTLLQLLTDLRGYALGESGEAQDLAARSISLLLKIARRYPRLRMTVIRPDLACFRLKPEEDDIFIEEI